MVTQFPISVRERLRFSSLTPFNVLDYPQVLIPFFRFSESSHERMTGKPETELLTRESPDLTGAATGAILCTS